MDLITAYWEKVWAFVYTVTRDPHLTDDITQDTFVAACQSLDQVREANTLKAWLFTIARNRCRDHFRSADFRRRTAASDEYMTTLSNGLALQVPSAEEEALGEIEGNTLWQRILRLKDSYREVLILHIKADLPFAEVAKILGIPERTARTRYRRAIEKLRQMTGGGVE